MEHSSLPQIPVLASICINLWHEKQEINKPWHKMKPKWLIGVWSHLLEFGISYSQCLDAVIK